MDDLTSWVDELVGLPAKQPRTRGALETANDWVIEGVNSGAGVVKAVSDMVSPNNPVSRGIGSFIEYGEERQSDVVKNAKSRLAESMETEDWQGQVGAVWDYVTENPGLAAAMVAGNLVPFAGAIRGAGAVGKGVAMARGADAAGVAKAGVSAGRVAGIGLGGMAAGGDAAGTAYDLVMNSENIPEDQREMLATRAARDASVLPAAFGAATGAFGVERILAGAGGRGGILRTAASEGLLQEAPEDALTQYSGRASAKIYDPTIDEWQGVAGAGAMGAVMGAGAGGAIGAMNPSGRRMLPPGQTADTPNADLLGGMSGPKINVVDPAMPLQQYLDTSMGIGERGAPKDYAKIFEQAAAEPSGVFVSDPETGVERELDSQQALEYQASLDAPIGESVPPVGQPAPAAQEEQPDPVGKVFSPIEQELVSFGIVPSKKSVEMFEAAKATGIDLDPDGPLQQFWVALAERKTGAAKKFLAQAVIETRKEQAAQNPGPVRVPPNAPTDVQNAAPAPVGTEVAAQAAPAQTPAPGGGVVPTADGVPAAGAGAGQAPAVAAEPTITIGRKGREKAVTRTELAELVKTMPATDRQRILATMGLEQDTDPDTGAPVLLQTANPRTADEVAAMDAQRTGKTVTRAAINNTLTKWGLSEEKINAALNQAAPDAVSAEDLGVRTDDGDANGFRVEDSASKATGQGLVDDGSAPTTAQREVIAQADTLLAPSTNRAESTYDPAQDATLEKRQAAAIAEGERDLARQLETDAAQVAVSDYNNSRADGAPEFDQLPLGLKLEYLDAYQDQVRETGNDWAPLEALIEQYSRSASVESDRQAGAVADAGGTAKEQAGARKTEGARGQVTPAETAWTELSSQFPMMPAWSALSERQQAQAADLVSRDQFNLAAANTVAGGTTAVNSDVLQSQGTGQAMEFDDVATYVGGIDSLPDQFAAAGIPNALDHVSEWVIENDMADSAPHGEIRPVNGRYTIMLNVAKLGDENYATEVARHEVGHAVDMAVHGGIYSIQPEMGVRLVDGRVVPVGAVSAQIVGLTKRFPQVKKFLNYPLNIKKFTELNTPARVQHELFAQIFAIYTTPKGKAFLEAEAPAVAAYFKEVLADVKSSKPVQIPTTANAERRTQAFQAGRAQRAGPAGAGVPAGAGERRTGALARKASSPSSGLPQIDQIPGNIGSLVQGLKDGTSWVAIRGMFTKDLLALAGKYMKSAREYLTEMEKIQVERGRFERQVDAILEDFRKLPVHLQGTGPGSVNAMIMDMTMERKWAFRPEWAPKAAIDAVMMQRFNAMPASAQDLVRRVFEHGHVSQKEMKAAALANISSEFDSEIETARAAKDDKALAKLEQKKAKALRDYTSLMELSSGWPYAPLKRFGKHVVMGISDAYRTARDAGNVEEMRKLESDPRHYYVAFAETKAEARKHSSDISSEYAEAGAFEKLDQADAWMGGRDVMGAFSRLRTLVRDQADANVGERTSKAMEDILRQMYLRMLSENSVRKSEFNRRTIAGADKDMMRSFATQGRATAHFIAGLKSNGKVSDALNRMKNEARSARLGSRDKPQALYNEIMRRHAMSLEYEAPGLVDKTMAGTSIWMLLTNPSYFLVNATQPWMMSQPMMAAKHGYGKASSALFTAYKDITPLVKDLKIEDADYAKLPNDVRAAVEELVNRGVIDISLESHLGSFRSTKDSVAGNAMEKATTAMRNAAQFVEAANRLSTAVAAYRLEIAGGASSSAAIDYAAKVIYETHGDYSGFNAPRLMRKGFGRLATQFRKFQLIQMSMFARFLNQSFKGATAEERAVARWALTYNLTHLFAMGGLMGLPGFTAISWIVGAAMGALGDDEPKDPEATLRRIIGDKDLADLLLKGMPKLGGVDVSGRIGAGSMLSILPFADPSLSREGYADAALGMAGPFFGGIAPRAADGMNLISTGKYWEGMEKFMPSGLANLLTATRYSMDGVTRRNGDVVMSADELSFLDWAAKSVGLPTNTLTDRQFLSNAQFKADEFYRSRTTALKSKYTKAVKDGDEATRREVIRDWQDTQAARRKVGFKVQPLSELLKAPREQAKRERNTVAGVQVRDTNRGFVEQLAQ
jgi:hypothetical protein